MTRARKLADLLDSNGDVKAVALDNDPTTLSDLGVTATATQLNYVDATSSVQTQINSKQATLGAGDVHNIHLASDIDASKLTTGTIPADRIGSGAITAAKLAPGAAVPTQSGQSGKYLTTDGTSASWSTVTQTQGMLHVFDTDNNGNLVWDNAATDIYDANFNYLHDAVIIGTDDMSFSVNNNGHLIMTIN